MRMPKQTDSIVRRWSADRCNHIADARGSFEALDDIANMTVSNDGKGMRPIFTIDAGEYLAATEIQKTFRDLQVWIPSKDTGIDLLVTDARQNRRPPCK